MVYDPVTQKKTYVFGVSGRLYMGNLLFFDRQTESLWSQLLSEAVTGPLAGTRLRVLPAENTTWGAWKREHPETLVLSFKTGYVRDYRKNPYACLGQPPEQALLVSAGGEVKIYPFSALGKSAGRVVDRLGGENVEVLYDGRTGTTRVTGATDFWYAGYADILRRFYPHAKVYRPGPARRRPVPISRKPGY